jgi:NAD(P)-dependent dehydrogenase (short-subunit alcohol dehydrogenase family)
LERVVLTVPSRSPGLIIPGVAVGTMIEPDLTGRVALVTGSAKGLGREFALSLADCGTSVAVHYRSSDEAAEATAAMARDRGAPEAITVCADVTSSQQVDDCFRTVEDELGTVDILVNNVGAFAPRHWEELDVETWHRVFDTNLTATYLCSRRVLPAMREAGWGRIVNVGYASSDLGLVSPKNFPYLAAKAGVLMFTRMLAGDTQNDGVTANAVSPYVVENSAEFPEELPRGRPAAFGDVTRALKFLVEEDADYVSGANIEVSGGWLPEDV